MRGLEVFKEKFADYNGNYVVIGGMACLIIFEDIGEQFRATQDVDMVLLIEQNNHDFAAAFWEFIKDGGYQERAQGSLHNNFYRFSRPSNPNYPKIIELFSRKPDGLVLKPDAHTMPIHIDDEGSSLSAILLNEEYYELLVAQKRVIDGISILNELALIPFKVKAFLEINGRIQKGIAEQSAKDNIKKHRRDVFRLARIISPAERILLHDNIKADMRAFIGIIRDEEFDLSQLGWRGGNAKNEFINLIEEVYQL